ncbi:flagellar protein MotY [Aliikangiella sp. IMCC44359]|uniref:flagellar protein MotY n=1 Tax=Aliikangiella sp. IMCC44359 TaxID=3459125 RepID=UPI00403AD48C
MTKYHRRLALLLSPLLICGYASANLKYFEADINDSNWQYKGTPLACNLSHNIPYYGTASFSKSAGKKTQLGFLLSYKRHELSPERSAWVRSIAPSWQPEQSSKVLGEVKLQKGKNIMSSHSTSSWRLLYELESGRFPTISYQDLNQQDSQVSVALSAVRFKPAYEKFLDCMTNLVRYDLKQIRKLTLYFDFDKYLIREKYEEKLKALAAYIKYDESIEVVFISGHTDSKGSRSYNDKLSKNRINSVKKLLQLDGVDDNRFKTAAYGEKKPVASNRSKKGRALNRRVYIRIAQR